MENKEHRLIVTSYELYTIENGTETFIEKTESERPMTIYTNCEMSIPSFEEEIVKYGTDTDFEFTLTKEQAYGEHDQDAVLKLDKAMFERDGKFDDEHVQVDAVLPLQNENGQRFMGKVLEIGESDVTIDLNHPLAGKDLHFKGHVIMNREAAQAEVDDFFNQMNQHSCSGGCGGGNCGGDSCGCGGGCHDGEEKEGGCCGNCH